MLSKLAQYQGKAGLYKLNFKMVFLEILASVNNASFAQTVAHNYKHSSVWFQQLILTLDWLNVTQFAKTRHNDAFLEIQIFASVSSIYRSLEIFHC